jgi:uncharacterized membrane protein
VLSKVCSIDLMWVFKILYPVIFSFAPIAIYRVTQKQTSDKVAFLSSFLFIATFSFFTVSLGTARFEVASLFLLLLVLLMVGVENSRSKAPLLFVFSLSLIVSHYALSTIFLLLVSAALILLFLSRRKSSNLSIVFVLVYSVMTLTWFSLVSSQSVLQTLRTIITFIGTDILKRFLDPFLTQPLGIIIGETKVPLLQFTKIVYLLAQVFIAVGILLTLLRRKNRIFKPEYFLLSVASFGLGLAGLLVPHLALSLNADRLYHYTLLFLSPFCIIGGIAVFDGITTLINNLKKNRLPGIHRETSIKAVSLFLSVYLLASTGLIFEISAQPISFSMLSLNSTSAWHAHFNDVEMIAAKWVNNSTEASANILVDFNCAHLFMMLRGVFSPLYGDTEVRTPIVNGDYVFLDYENLVDGIVRLGYPEGRGFGNSTMIPLLQNSTFWNDVHSLDKIYDAGDVQVFYHGYAESP